MSVYWMANILLGIMFCQARQGLSICNCNDHLITVCAAPRETVHVPCPYLGDKDLMFNLIKNEDVISNCVFSSTNKTLNCDHKLSSDIIVSENQTGFNLTVTNASSHGIYKCDSQSTFPPPVEKATGPSKILVLVQGHQCLRKTEEVHKSHKMDLSLVWITVTAFLCTYSLIVSIIAVVNWVKLKRSDSYSDYMNTKPRPSKERKKRRGIQTPTPRHF
ncbi:T-cell-specific surface glycoprotein CD28 [Sphaeramia orbicularis]|uniref:T-cell-specific surface glycoprotein CD28-like n=1 Tax=Sphaeramia orbicularis TaxID=375764 RepID=A0A672YVJ3_9TELE|nr:T-cell-specific surface glycoprotein CD28-like [Sphaeramia orbicularis]